MIALNLHFRKQSVTICSVYIIPTFVIYDAGNVRAISIK